MVDNRMGLGLRRIDWSAACWPNWTLRLAGKDSRFVPIAALWIATQRSIVNFPQTANSIGTNLGSPTGDSAFGSRLVGPACTRQVESEPGLGGPYKLVYCFSILLSASFGIANGK